MQSLDANIRAAQGHRAEPEGIGGQDGQDVLMGAAARDRLEPRGPWRLNPIEDSAVSGLERALNAEVRANIDALGSALFSDFTPMERRLIMRRMVAAKPRQAWGLIGVQRNGLRVEMTRKQRRLIDEMIASLPRDALGVRARQAFARRAPSAIIITD